MIWLKRLAISIPLILLVTILAGYFWLRTSLPDYRGTLAMPEIEEDVTIVRDSNAVPHIYAKTEKDAFFALGYVHAQDRLWQMEMNRRTGAGRLSEILGDPAIGTDRFLRTIGVYEAARKAYQYLDQRTKDNLNAYVAGINNWLEMRKGALPPEFFILGFEPEPWTVTDCLVWMKMMAFDLGANYATELTRASLLQDFPASMVETLLPNLPSENWPPLPELEEIFESTILNAVMQPEKDRGLGSNNWVISGAKTTTGKPLLANDPHLGLKAPSLWYLVHLQIEDRNIVGVSLPSLPLVILGRNDQAAWGFTNTGPDVQDLFVERILPDGRYQTPTGPADFDVHQEIIHVRNSDPVIIDVRHTRHGPVISDALPSTAENLPPDHVLALQWTALQEEDRGLELGGKLLDIASFADFKAAMQSFTVPQQNMVFANTDGDIGLYAPGNVPVRAEENLVQGRYPVPGWDPVYDWQGFIPHEDLPEKLNPETGYVATANYRIVDNDYPYRLADRWAPPQRTERIVEMIEATDRHDLETMKAMQMDEYSLLARAYLPRLLNAVDGHSQYGDMLTRMAKWDHIMRANAPEPLIFMAWFRALGPALYQDELAEKFNTFWGLREDLVRQILLEGSASDLCDNIQTEVIENCNDRIRHAFETALQDLESRHGETWQKWQWGNAHISLHAHQPFENLPVLKNIFSIRAGKGGGPYTVNVAGIATRSENWEKNTHGPSFRGIYDLADLEKSLFMIPTGQSGNLLSPFYNQFTDDWIAGRYITIPTNREAIEDDVIGILVLQSASLEKHNKSP